MSKIPPPPLFPLLTAQVRDFKKGNVDMGRELKKKREYSFICLTMSILDMTFVLDNHFLTQI